MRRLWFIIITNNWNWSWRKEEQQNGSPRSVGLAGSRRPSSIRRNSSRQEISHRYTTLLLSSKTLATYPFHLILILILILILDASIWLVQFMKAMRDDKGEMVRNAHLLGFFRRICKLLYLRTKPVFVFDGATPALKRRTVIARRRLRENAQAKIRKTAEKLLLNQVCL